MIAKQMSTPKLKMFQVLISHQTNQINDNFVLVLIIFGTLANTVFNPVFSYFLSTEYSLVWHLVAFYCLEVCFFCCFLFLSHYLDHHLLTFLVLGFFTFLKLLHSLKPFYFYWLHESVLMVIKNKNGKTLNIYLF